MAIRYVDANVLENLAGDVNRTESEVQDILNSCTWRVNAAPWRGWDQGLWWDTRHTLNNECWLLDDDRRALLRRADRTRVVAQQATLPWWSGIASLLGLGKQFADSIDEIVDRHVFEWLQSGSGEVLDVAAMLIHGGLLHAHEWLSFAKQDLDIVLMAAVLKKLTLAHPYAHVLLDVPLTFLVNYGEYGGDLQKTAAATIADTALKLSVALLAVGAAAVIGATCPVTLPALPIVFIVSYTMAGLVVDEWIDQTAPYKAFVNDPVKATSDFGKWVGSGIGQAANGIGQSVSSVGRTTRTAVEDAGEAVRGAVGKAGKGVDKALDSGIDAVTKPFDTLESWFGPERSKSYAAA